MPVEAHHVEMIQSDRQRRLSQILSRPGGAEPPETELELARRVSDLLDYVLGNCANVTAQQIIEAQMLTFTQDVLIPSMR